MNCPKCQGNLRRFTPTSEDMFCLDCDYDTLSKPAPEGAIPVDAEWYLKTHLRMYRKWTDPDFEVVKCDWGGAYGKYSYPGAYYHRQTVERHEATSLFQSRLNGKQQRPVPDDKRIDTLAWRLTIRGDELIASGWDIELVGKLTPHKDHRWRKRRSFYLADLKDIAKDQPPLLGWKAMRAEWKRQHEAAEKASEMEREERFRKMQSDARHRPKSTAPMEYV